MKRISLMALLTGLGALCVQAANDTDTTTRFKASYKVSSQVLKENNFRNAPWMGSGNTAGLAFKPFEMYKALDLQYEHITGDFHTKQDAGKADKISLNTSGSAYLGKFIVWGSFSFRNNIERERNMNALMYEIEDDMPYYPVDTTKNSRWRKQEYELQAKLASPVLWDRVSFGVDIKYLNQVGAKQLDPRAETYRYSVRVRPAAAVRAGNNMIGLNVVYQNVYERSDPSNMNNWVNQAVYLHRGLGESIRGKVGDNDGIAEYMFKTNHYGGALQYGYSSNAQDADRKGFDLLAEIAYTMTSTDVVSKPKLPKKEGSTMRTDISGKVDLLWGRNKSNSLSIAGLYRNTGGTEYVQKIVTESNTMQYWQVLSQSEMSHYTLMTASIGYDHLFDAGNPRGYSWIVGADARMYMRNEIYYLPESTFKATTAHADVFGGKQFRFKTSSLLIKIHCGYQKSLGSEYVYGGKNNKNEPVKMYQGNCEYYGTDYVDAGGNIAYTINTKKIGYVINVAADYIKPLGASTDRIFAKASFGIVF